VLESKGQKQRSIRSKQKRKTTKDIVFQKSIYKKATSNGYVNRIFKYLIILYVKFGINRRRRRKVRKHNNKFKCYRI